MKKLYFLLFASLYFSAQSQVINFPDPVFKAKLMESGPFSNIAWSGTVGVDFIRVKIDANNNGEIEQSEAAAITKLELSNSGIASLEGINYFYNVEMLACSGNNLASLDISNLTQLYELYCQNNALTTIQMPVISPISEELAYIDCKDNLLTSIDLSSYKRFDSLYLQNNQLTTVDLSHVHQMEYVNLSDNPITSFHYVLPDQGVLGRFTLSTNTLLDVYLDASESEPSMMGIPNVYITSDNLVSLTCYLRDDPPMAFPSCYFKGPATSLDLRGRFDQLSIFGTLSEQIDLSQCHLNVLDLGNVETNYLNIKNGDNMSTFMNMTPIPYVCADDYEIHLLTQFPANLPDASINSYCTFTPGGEFFNIEGNVRCDLNNNGCESSDPAYPQMNFQVTNGNISGNVISNMSGNYQLPVQAGSHTMTPVLENPSYFSISPASVTVNFPADSSPAVHNFCVTPVGIHNDLEVVIIPMGVARPGFYASYKVLYKNKGNTTLSGTVTFSYDNTVSFVQASPSVGTQSGQSFLWDFNNLQPFETRETVLLMQVSTPTQTPAVNDGTILNYTAEVTFGQPDETPDNNIALLHQTAINSFDPNDKTCLEGNTISPAMVGKYVHYLIRFENTGTANAVNIVVKDEIDAAKFDIASLVPMDGSHNFITRINGNKVEFIFENIELPFDDAHNDGYVMFKIKTRPTLVLGNSFSNAASIYFDYNHPIVTDPAVTTISVLKNQDFEFSDAFALYPNPTSEVLNIQSKSSQKIASVEIYNALGQLVQTEINTGLVAKINVSALVRGNYFIRLSTEKGYTNTQFIKQ